MKIRNKQILIILLIFVFHSINNYIWLRLDHKPVFDDQAFHLLGGLQITDMLSSFHHGGLSKIIGFHIVHFYPPLFHFCMAIFNILFGKSLVSSIMANTIFLAILYGSLYYIGKKLGNKNIGVLSIFIVSMYPFIFGLSRSSLPDFALTAMVTLSLCCLFYTDYFTKRLFSLLFGISFGLGMLTKQVFIFFIITPLICVVWELFSKREMDKSRASNLFISFLIAFLLSGYWYVSNLMIVLPNYIRAGYHDAVMFGSVRLFSLSSLSYYLYQLAANQMSFFFCIIFLVGAMKLFRTKAKMKFLLFLSIVGVYLIFTFLIKTKEPKSTVPYLPIFAIISSAGILSVKPTRLRLFFITFLIIFGLYQYFFISYTSTPNNRSKIPFRNLFFSQGYLDPIISYHHFPSQDNCGVNEVLLLIKRQEKDGKKICGVSGQDAALMRKKGTPWRINYITTNYYTIEYYCRLSGLTSTIVNLDKESLSKPWWEVDDFSPDTLILVDALEKQVPEYIVQRYRLFRIIVLSDKSISYAYTKNDN